MLMVIMAVETVKQRHFGTITRENMPFFHYLRKGIAFDLYQSNKQKN